MSPEPLPPLLLALALASACSHGQDDPKPDPSVTRQLTDAGITPKPDASPDIDASPDAAPPRTACPTSLPGPRMVLVTTPKGVPYCIAATEVPQGQYFKFLEAKGADPKGYPAGDMSGQIPECETNKTYASVMQEGDGCYHYYEAWDPWGGHPEYPVGCVEWCDAYAYCAWAGKRLCGKVGGGRGTFDDAANAELDQWYNACSQGGKTKYSYGDQEDATRCVSKAYTDAVSAQTGTEVVAPRPPGEAEHCHGTESPYDQIVDLSGNMGEWVDIRGTDRPGGHSFGIRGYLNYAPGEEEQTLLCGWATEHYEHSLYTRIGFRCCLD